MRSIYEAVYSKILEEHMWLHIHYNRVIFINKSFLFCMVEGISMQPTLNEKDYILVNKVNVCLSSFHHGDVVIIKRKRLLTM